eukprot:g11200.t1
MLLRQLLRAARLSSDTRPTWRRKALESQLTLLVNLQQALMFIDALYEKWSARCVVLQLFWLGPRGLSFLRFGNCLRMARNKRSASPERAKKKRKVVLVKAQQAAAERGRAAVKPTAKVARAKPAPIPGGTAGRLLEWLGHGRTDTPRLGAGRRSVPTALSSPDSRSPTSPVLAVVTPAKVTKRPKAASPKKAVQKETKVKKRAAPPAASLAPAKAKKANDGSSVPTKAKKTEAPPAPVKVKKPPPEKPKPKRVEAVQVVTPAAAPAAQPELSELDQMGLQDAVLERLRTLCDKDVDPKVLAEYIVVLAQMNKGPDHLSGELEAFFSDKACKLFQDLS